MIIEYTNHISCDFADLWCGTAFAFYEDGEKYICMKTDSNIQNAVNLSTGEMYEIEPHQRVFKIDAKIVVD